MLSKLRAGIPFIALAFVAIAVLFIASCRTDQVEVPTLTGPGGARLFLTMDASPDKILIKTGNHIAPISRITIQLKDQLGHPVPNEKVAFRIINAEGSEVGIGTLDATTRTTDSGGFARVTYTAPSAEFQPVPTIVYIYAVMMNPSYANEVTARQKLDLELARPFECVSGPGAPTVSFTSNPNPPVLNQLTCFDAQGTSGANSIISYSWTFGDGGRATGPTACHTFKRRGQVSVTLTVVDANQNCSTLTQFFDVGVGGTPTCSFTASPNPVSTDTLVFLDASASTDADGRITSFKWDFGDGKTGNGEKTSHMWNITGGFTVTLIVTDDAGNESTCNKTVTVATGVPTCTFTITPNPADVGETVVFNGTNSKDPEGQPLTFSWDLDGDGTFGDATGAVVSNSYSTQGTVIINLQVTDNENNQVVCTNALTIGNQPPSCDSFQANNTTIQPGGSVDFTVLASDPDNDALTVTFNTPGGTPNSSVDSTAPFEQTGTVYANAGTFTATASVSDGNGGTDTCTAIQIKVATPGSPACSFTVDPSPACVNDNVVVDATASTPPAGETITSYAWDFTGGNPTTGTGVQSFTTYTTTGAKSIGLTVNASNGQSCNTNRIVQVNGSPAVTSISSLVNFCAGGAFTITGSNLLGSTVTIDGISRTVGTVNNTSINVNSGAGALTSGPHTITVTTSCGSSSFDTVGAATTCP